MSARDITPGEWHAVLRLRALKAEQGGHGWGFITVEVVDGREKEVELKSVELSPRS